GNAVRKLRRQMGISQEELAERADLHRTYIAGIERGGRNITLRSIDKLAKAFNVSVAALLTLSAGDLTDNASAANVCCPAVIDILLIEDDPDDAELTVKALTAGHLTNRVHIVRDGPQALDFLFAAGEYTNRRNDLPQLIMLDLTLPKLSGLEVLQRLKHDPRTQNIAIIVLTGSTNGADMAECKRLGIEHYIVKPVEFSAFRSVVQQHSFPWALLKPSPCPVAS
ncbi:MAG: helix-turn-helix domain-containing protein, partial [Limisphaerales bacterium]